MEGRFYKQLKTSTNEKSSIVKRANELLAIKNMDALETIAQEARDLSINHFGKSIVLYAPVYVANYCTNMCTYCSYHLDDEHTQRRVLNLKEVEEEGRVLYKRGIRHIVLLTGDDPKRSSVEYIGECVRVLRQFFESIVIEVYALSEEEYAHLVACGISGVTLYQETYDEAIYKQHHPKGPKSDYVYRLEAVERAIKGGARQINIGVLLGLANPLKDMCALIEHLDYLTRYYPHVEYSVSLPRLKPIDDMTFQPYETTLFDYVKFLCTLRILHPHVAQNVSTRETADFRKHLIPIGVNKMSAGVSTEVGGYAALEKGSMQFAISDESSVEDVKNMIIHAGYQPTMKDWVMA